MEVEGAPFDKDSEKDELALGVSVELLVMVPREWVREPVCVLR